jgi:1-acyl-sn-glycerol-3-phosphate acyltransferase
MLWLLRLPMKLLLRLEVTGLTNIPTTGPVIIIINHIALLDPLLVCGICPRPVIPMAKKEAFDSSIWGPLLKGYGAIPIQRGEADVRAIKATLQVLRDQGVILMAPEGTRSPTYQLQPGKDGVAMIALRSRATLVPIGITGSHHLKSYWRKLSRPPVKLNIGEPFQLSPLADQRKTRPEMNAITHELMYRLAKQLPPEYRGVYHNLAQASGDYVTPIQQLPQIP